MASQALKFGRNYYFTINFNNGTEPLIIAPPFTVEFDITRNVLSAANVCQLRFYNLSKDNRNRLRYDFSNTGQNWPLIFSAGYGLNLPVCFTGNVTQAWSVREGTNYITTIECFDGGIAFANSVSTQNFKAGTPLKTMIASIANDMKPYGITLGAIGNNYSDSTNRGNSYVGPSMDLIKEISGANAAFIDQGKLYVLGENECIQGDLQTINSDIGLLGTPVREQSIVNFDMVFEPRLILAQKIILQSSTDQNFNGNYKVVSLKHRGMISESVCGEVVTSVGFFFGVESLVQVNAA